MNTQRRLQTEAQRQRAIEEAEEKRRRRRRKRLAVRRGA